MVRYEVYVFCKVGMDNTEQFQTFKLGTEAKDWVLRFQSNPDSGYVGHRVVQVQYTTVEQAGEQRYTDYLEV